MTHNTPLVFKLIIIAILAAGSGSYFSLKKAQQSAQANPTIEGFLWPNPKQLKPFSVIDQSGKPFGLAQLKDQWSFVFFGYTHCPDICPITMTVMAAVYNETIDRQHNIQIIFVSVDPKRDTIEKRLQYVGYFNEHFIGLGGDTDMINSLTKQIGIAYYVDQKEETGDYLVDHSASIFLFDPAGRMVGKFSAPHEKNKIIQQFTQIKDFIIENS